MAKNDKQAKDAAVGGHSVDDLKKRLLEGEQMPAGVCLNFDNDPPFYACSDEDEAVARGDISRSIDGGAVTDLATGTLTRREPTNRYAGSGPIVGDVATAGGGLTGVASTPAGGAGGGGGARGGDTTD